MAGTEFRRYLEVICADPSFATRRRSYVPTDLLDRQQQRDSQSVEQPDFSSEFAAFDLDLNVQTAQEDKQKPEGLELEQGEKIERLPVLEGIRKYAADHVLLVGKPGSGKSTALERLLVQEAELALGNVQAPIPVLLKLRDLRTSVWKLLRLSLESRDPNLRTIDLPALLTSGRLLLLWDGVNELPTGLDELKELRQRYRQTPMIFTTRTLSAGSNLGIEKKLEMQPLTEPQMRQFTCNYLGKEKGDRLIRQLEQRLREFGETPLLLWMLCGIYSKAGQIPSNLGSVFRLFVSIYDQQKGFDEKARLWQSRFLQALAFAMMPQGDPKGLRLSILKSEAVDLFAKLLEKETDPLTRAIDYLDDLLRYHLLQSKNSSEIEFRHQLFQEYYAAEHLLRQLDKLDDLTLKKVYLNSVDWTESLALMLGMLDNQQEASRVVQLSLEVDLLLGARLTGAVKLHFQQQTVNRVIALDTPELLKVDLLGRTQSELAIDHVSQFLKSEDFRVRVSTIYALSRISSPQIIEPMMQALNDDDPHVRASVVQVFEKIGSKKAVEGLLQALRDKNPSVLCTSILALWRIRTEQAKEGWHEFINSIYFDIHLLREAVRIIEGNERVIEDLLQPIEDITLRSKYKRILTAVDDIQGSIGVAQWFENIEIRAKRICQFSIDALQRVCDKETVERFQQLFLIYYDGFSFNATVFLEIYSCDFIEGLIQLLDHNDSDTRTTAAKILVAIDSMEILRWLPKILNHQDCRMWGPAAKALERMTPEQAIDGWICILANQTNPRVSKSRCLLIPSAAHVLKDIGTPKELPQLWEFYRFGNEEVLDAIFAIQERCRFYNNEIEQMDLSIAAENAYSSVNQYTFPNAQEVKIFEQVDTYHDRSTDT